MKSPKKAATAQTDRNDPLVTIELPHSGNSVKTIVPTQGRAGANTDVRITLEFTKKGTASKVSKSVTERADGTGFWRTGVVGGDESEPATGVLTAFKDSPNDGGTRNRLTLAEVPDIGLLAGEATTEFRKAGGHLESGTYDPKKGSRVVCMLTPVGDDTWVLAFPHVIALGGTWLCVFRNPTAKAPPYTLWAFLLDPSGNVVSQHTRKID